MLVAFAMAFEVELHCQHIAEQCRHDTPCGVFHRHPTNHAQIDDLKQHTAKFNVLFK